jgi:hypothetical protein
MVLDAGVHRCENVESLQEIINALLVSRAVLFKRRRGDAGAVHDFILGQTAILYALVYLSAVPSVSESLMTEIIETVWRRYGLGPTLGNGQACQYLLNLFYEKFSEDSRLAWPGWERFDW